MHFQSGVSAVILDWAGTAVDHGCHGPLAPFRDAFAAAGVPVTLSEARGPMGLPKRDHVAAICQLPAVRERWQAAHGREPGDADVESIYQASAAGMVKSAPPFSRPIPGAVELLAALREQGIAVGSTTGYTREIMDAVIPVAREHGYSPDAVVTPQDIGGTGRPAPFMIFENARQLGRYPVHAMVKIGDTRADIAEAQSAGMWSIALTRTGNELGLNLAEYEAMLRERPDELRAQLEQIAARFRAAGADYIIESVADALPVIQAIDARIRAGERPGSGARENPYLLLTPGPLSTSRNVRTALLRDWCTWDDEYKGIVQSVRGDLCRLACVAPDQNAGDYSAVLMQGSGTFSVEATLGGVLPQNGVLLILSNGAYGERMVATADRLGLSYLVHQTPEDTPPDLERLAQALRTDDSITHVAGVHCETTTGMLNPAEAIGRIVHEHGRTWILDAMSSFAGVPLFADLLGADFLISSANKCIQGVPGFGFVIARRTAWEALAGDAYRPHSLALDLYEQWRVMESDGGKWRFTSPTHTVRAFRTALDELQAEGGTPARHARYLQNQQRLAAGMADCGFPAFLAPEHQSPIITAFRHPAAPDFQFANLYAQLKAAGFVIYPGKVSSAETFRIGTIGEVYVSQIEELLKAVREFSNGL